MNEFDVLGRAAGGMDVQRTVLDLAARNVAAAQASGPDHPFARLVAQIADGADEDEPFDGEETGPRVVGTRAVPAEADPLTEMIGVLDAQRAYEMDASIFDVGKRLAERTIDVERS